MSTTSDHQITVFSEGVGKARQIFASNVTAVSKELGGRFLKIEQGSRVVEFFDVPYEHRYSVSK
jgi:hypothetical protein